MLSFSSFLFAQTNESEKGLNCPSLSVTPPPAAVAEGENVEFTANLVGEVDKYKISYVWSVDSGKIISGQGTPRIIVSTEGLSDTTVNATVEIIGLPEECPNSASDATIPTCGVNNILIDEFGEIPNDDLINRLDNLFVHLTQDQTATGYILNYGSAKEIKKRESLFKDFFIRKDYDLSKVVFVNGGNEKEIRTRLWIVPQGADPSSID